MPARNALETTGLYLTLPNALVTKIDKIVERDGTLANRQDIIRQLIVEALGSKKWKNQFE